MTSTRRLARTLSGLRLYFHTDYKLNVTPDFLSNDGRNVCRTFNDETKLCHVSEVEPKSGKKFNVHFLK